MVLTDPFTGREEIDEGLKVPFTMMVGRVWPNPMGGGKHSSFNSFVKDSNNTKIKPPKNKKLVSLFSPKKP